MFSISRLAWPGPGTCLFLEPSFLNILKGEVQSITPEHGHFSDQDKHHHTPQKSLLADQW